MKIVTQLCKISVDACHIGFLNRSSSVEEDNRDFETFTCGFMYQFCYNVICIHQFGERQERGAE